MVRAKEATRAVTREVPRAPVREAGAVKVLAERAVPVAQQVSFRSTADSNRSLDRLAALQHTRTQPCSSSLDDEIGGGAIRFFADVSRRV